MENVTQLPAIKLTGECPNFSDILMACLFFSMFLIGFLLNLVLLIAIWREKLYLKPSNLFLMNLAISDMGIAVGILFFPFMNYAATEWPFGEMGCRTFETIRFIVTPVSLLSLAAMSHERYIAVHATEFRPSKKNCRFSCKGFLSSKSGLVIIGIWVLSIITLIPIEVTRNFEGIAEDKAASIRICMLDRYQFMETKIYVIIRCAITWVIPLFTIVYNYSSIAMRLMDISSSLERHKNNATLERSRRKAVSRAKMILILVVIFLLCSFPCHCFLWIYYFNSEAVDYYGEFWDVWRQVGFYSFDLYPILNPLFLYTTSTQYRNLFDKYLFCCCNMNPVVKSEEASAIASFTRPSKPSTEEEFLSITKTF